MSVYNVGIMGPGYCSPGLVFSSFLSVLIAPRSGSLPSKLAPTAQIRGIGSTVFIFPHTQRWVPLPCKEEASATPAHLGVGVTADGNGPGRHLVLLPA